MQHRFDNAVTARVMTHRSIEPHQLMLVRFSMIRRVSLVLLLIVIGLRSSSLYAQNGGALTGVVLDPDHKAVVAATVMVRNDSSGEVKTVVTDDTGHFSVTGLLPGSYSVEVFVPGFETVRRTSVQVDSTKTAEIAADITVGSISVAV